MRHCLPAQRPEAAFSRQRSAALGSKIQNATGHTKHVLKTKILFSDRLCATNRCKRGFRPQRQDLLPLLPRMVTKGQKVNGKFCDKMQERIGRRTYCAEGLNRKACLPRGGAPRDVSGLRLGCRRMGCSGTADGGGSVRRKAVPVIGLTFCTSFPEDSKGGLIARCV